MKIKVNKENKVGNLMCGNIIQTAQGGDNYFILSNHFRKVGDVQQEALVVNLATGDAQWFDMDMLVWVVEDAELVVGG